MSQPDFQPLKILIHGVGLIGGSIGLAAKRHGVASEVIGAGRNVGRLETAAQLGAIDRYVSGNEILAANSDVDLIILCTPVSQIINDLPATLRTAGSDTIITDVGSVKGAIVDAANGDPRFVGSHPMAGLEIAGVEAARAELFQDAVWAITPTDTTSDIAIETVRHLAQALGANTKILSPGLHDQAVATTSHLPHVIASALVALASDQAYDNCDLPFLSAGSFADGTRVAASSPKLWRDICTHNRHALSKSLAQYRTELDAFQAVLDERDDDEIEAFFARGKRAKNDWPRG